MRRFERGVVLGLVLGCVTLGCRGGDKPLEPPKTTPLRLLATHSLTFPEPSGLAINDSGTVLWVVTNDPDRIHQLDLNGTVVRTLAYRGQDLEGIAYDASDRTLWIVEENRREVVHLDLNGDILSTHPLDLTGELNSGLEGICLDDQGHLFVLNEKRPGLFIELNSSVAIATRQDLYFAQDYSDISYNPRKACFWIVSDQSRRLYQWSKSEGVISQYALPFDKAEGIAFDNVAQLIYIVSDFEQKLYVYSEKLQ